MLRCFVLSWNGLKKRDIWANLRHPLCIVNGCGVIIDGEFEVGNVHCRPLCRICHVMSIDLPILHNLTDNRLEGTLSVLLHAILKVELVHARIVWLSEPPLHTRLWLVCPDDFTIGFPLRLVRERSTSARFVAKLAPESHFTK